MNTSSSPLVFFLYTSFHEQLQTQRRQLVGGFRAGKGVSAIVHKVSAPFPPNPSFGSGKRETKGKGRKLRLWCKSGLAISVHLARKPLDTPPHPPGFILPYYLYHGPFSHETKHVKQGKTLTSLKPCVLATRPTLNLFTEPNLIV